MLRAHPGTLHDKAQVPVGKVYQYVHPCALKFVHHIKNPAIRDDVLLVLLLPLPCYVELCYIVFTIKLVKILRIAKL